MAAYNNSSTGGAAARRQNDDGAAHLYYPNVRDAQNEDAKMYIDGNMPPATAKNAAVEKGSASFLDLPRALGFAAGRGQMLPYPTQMTAAAVEPAAGYYNSGEALPLASQVFSDKTATSAPAVAVGQDKDAGAFPQRLRRGLPVLGLSVASLAVAGLAAGEPTPAAGFGLFFMLIVGLSAVTIRALRD